MADNGSPAPRFRISASGDVLAELKQCQEEASAGGRGPAFLAALKRIYTTLPATADTFGEALRELPNARLQIRLAVVAPIVVEFGVHHADAVVHIRGFQLLTPGRS